MTSKNRSSSAHQVILARLTTDVFSTERPLTTDWSPPTTEETETFIGVFCVCVWGGGGVGSIMFGSKSSHLRVGEVAQIDTLVSREGRLDVRLLKLKKTMNVY